MGHIGDWKLRVSMQYIMFSLIKCRLELKSLFLPTPYLVVWAQILVDGSASA